MSRPTQHMPSATDARSLAQRCLEDVLLHNMDVQEALDACLRRVPLCFRDHRETGLATEIVYGYLRLKARLDFVVERFLSKPKGVPPALRILLGQCAYALVELERVPAYATVDWGVRSAKKRFGAGLGKLVNAVLRNITRLEGDARVPDFYRLRGDAEKVFLARYYSCPLWIVEIWLAHYGEETALHYLQGQAAPAPLGVRLNQRHPDYRKLHLRLENEAAPLLALPPGFALHHRDALPDLDGLELQGALSRQSLASLQTLQELGAFNTSGAPSWPLPIWDACAGHGGKSCALLEARGPEIYSSDISQKRLRGLRRELKRLALPEIPLFFANAEKPPLAAYAGTILVDAPCSGLGVLSRRPDAKWRRTPQDVTRLASTQRNILRATAGILAPGGVLAYVTCTLHPKENQDQVRALTAKGATDAGLELIHEWRTPPDSPLREYFFGALLRKR